MEQPAKTAAIEGLAPDLDPASLMYQSFNLKVSGNKEHRTQKPRASSLIYPLTAHFHLCFLGSHSVKERQFIVFSYSSKWVYSVDSVLHRRHYVS